MALVTWAFIAGVLVLAMALVAVKLASGPSPAAATSQPAAPASVVAAVAGLAPSLFDSAAGFGGSGPQILSSQPPLEVDGRTEVVFVGSQSSPYSAAASWAVVVALSRFGTWAHLGSVTSPATEVFGRTPGFALDGASYRSSHVALVETERNTATLSAVAPAGYVALQTPSSATAALLRRYDDQAGGPALPFLDVGNRLVAVGAGIGFSPGLLQGQSMNQVAGALGDPASAGGRAVLAAADELIAAVCAADGEQPLSVCSGAGVRASAQRLGLS